MLQSILISIQTGNKTAGSIKDVITFKSSEGILDPKCLMSMSARNLLRCVMLIWRATASPNTITSARPLSSGCLRLGLGFNTCYHPCQFLEPEYSEYGKIRWSGGETRKQQPLQLIAKWPVVFATCLTSTMWQTIHFYYCQFKATTHPLCTETAVFTLA